MLERATAAACQVMMIYTFVEAMWLLNRDGTRKTVEISLSPVK